MDTSHWKINDTIICQQLTAEYLEQSLKLIETAFYPFENICRTLGLGEDVAAMAEVRDLTNAAAQDGVTIVAIDKTTNNVVGIALNKIQVRDNPVFENFAKTWKQANSKAIVQFMAEIDNLCNLFDHCQIDCCLELMFLATSPDYRGKGIGKKLTEFTIEIGRNLAKGVNVKKSVDGRQLSLEPAPKIVCAIFTSFITQKIGKDLGFEIAAERQYADMVFAERTFEKVVTSGTTKLTLEYKKL